MVSLNRVSRLCSGTPQLLSSEHGILAVALITAVLSLGGWSLGVDFQVYTIFTLLKIGAL